MGRPVYYYGGNKTRLTPEQVAYYAYNAGFRGEDLVKAVAISKRESGWVPNIHGSDRPQSEYSGDRGLWQINYVHDDGMMRNGIYSKRTDLFDPQVNANAAYQLYAQAGGTFKAWTAASGGWTEGGNPLYGTNVDEARAAVSNASKAGLFGKGRSWVPDWEDLLKSIPGVPGTPYVDDWTNDLIPNNPLDLITEPMDMIAAFVRMLADPRTWVRVLQMAGGSILIAIGVVVLSRDVVDEAINLTPAGAVANAVS